ncbi:MAG: hypothetical protein SAJ37_12490, partial [Oscillatoria sp. PMC 1068.18]|nr:hypothetical protein [Oscillatoria sp. PMC 1068.18]
MGLSFASGRKLSPLDPQRVTTAIEINHTTNELQINLLIFQTELDLAAKIALNFIFSLQKK